MFTRFVIEVAFFCARVRTEERTLDYVGRAFGRASVVKLALWNFGCLDCCGWRRRLADAGQTCPASSFFCFGIDLQQLHSCCIIVDA